LAVLGAALVLIAAAPALAQNTGTISGVIVDQTQQVVPGATVTLTNERTGDNRTFVSDDRGEFSFRAVPPGTYALKVELSGFRTLERRRNVLNASGHLDLGRLALELGNLTEVVTVEASGALVETKTSDYSGLLTSTQISQIQTRGRDVVSLLRLLPGVRYENDIDAMGDSFGSQMPNIGGQRRHWNQVTVDGLNGNELSGTNRFSSAINLDAIAEVKVLLNTYKAEFGRTGGANVEIVSKSGSTEYRGSGYWFGRRDKWNATPWENIRAGTAKPKSHIDTYGLNLGGPVYIPWLAEQKSEKKLFFFYSLEAPQVQRPGPKRLFRMPTELERNGDFSQSYDTAGRKVAVVDPVTRQPFLNNVIPADRIDPSVQRLLQSMPLPNEPGVSNTYNFSRQETSENPRWNNLVRLDARLSGDTSVWGTVRTFNSNQYGAEITAAPARWGFMNGAYLFSDDSITGGWNRILGPSLINEFQAGMRRQTEGFQTKDESDWSHIRKSDIDWTLGQLNPQLNPLGLMPRVTFGLATTGTDAPDFTYEQRLGATAQDWLFSLRDNVTWVRGDHSFKSGGYLEYMRNNEARGGVWMGEFNFSRNTNNPFDTGFAYSNALLGIFSQYTETDRHRETKNRAWMSEFYAQDTWKMRSRVTLDYGARFLWYTPYWRSDDRVSNFDPALYDPAKAPRLYLPATIGGKRKAYDPVTGQVLEPIYIGAYVPGTGDETNGMRLAGKDGVPRSFRQTLAPQIEPRLGFAWDVTDKGTTVVHASAGLFHNARLGGGSLGNMAANPPFIHTPVFYYGSTGTLLAGGSAPAITPVQIEALETDYKTPSSVNWSAGIRRDIGWGTTVDATYAGSRGRNLEMYYDLNAVPDGARFLDLHPENRDPTTNGVLPPQFLRPYRGYQSIRVRGNFGTSDYKSFQIQVNRRYIRGVQFGGSYTWQKARGLADEDPGNPTFSRNRPTDFYYSILAQSQTHNLVINYTWDLPDLATTSRALRLALNGWQISGENAFVSGEWAPVTFTTADTFDFTGGESGQGGEIFVRTVVVGDPMAGERDPVTGWFDTAAFQRPSGRGDYGNSPRNVVQRPGVKNWNLALFKNVPFGGHRAFQLRIEAYNVLNTVQFQDIDRAAVFNAAGVQTKATFGTAVGINNPTRPPRVIQLSLRFNF
jgi:hypothetical protein